jgi:hypothetical protein
MKSFIRLSLLMVAIASFASCTKVVIDARPASITGSWVLTDAAQKDRYGWYTVTTGVEYGVFTFYSNGRARYVENGVVLEGSWNIQTLTSGYYDEYGNYYTNSHQSLSIYVSDYYGDDVIDMYFDNVRISNNSFVGTNYTHNTIGRYRFSRY